MTVSSQLVGSPCGQRGSYLFYKSFRLWKNGKTKSISVGDCFFVNTTFSPTLSSTDVDNGAAGTSTAAAESDGTLCIGELQLLWEDKNINRTLTSCRLYFLPENTPKGRLEHHGEDEVLVMSERVVLHVDDLVQWIAASDVRWEHGLKGLYNESNSTLTTDPAAPTGQIQSEVKDDVPSQETTLNNTDVDVNKDHVKTNATEQDSGELAVKILSFSQYCRYRAILKRLEHMPESWFYNALVIAMGGFTVSTPNWRLLFCRESFDHPELDTIEFHCGHLAPCLKGRRKKKQLKKKRSNSPSSESNESVELQLAEYDSKCGLKSVVTGEELEEQEFLERLFKFMRHRNTPIERIPHLGFKQINLYVFYTFVQKLGGYHKITVKKLWKQIYDELGGDPGSTSAATNTRRHYERLLLPFERHDNSQNRSIKDKQELDASRSSPAASPVQLSVQQCDTERLTLKDVVTTETFIVVENSLSPVSVQHDKDISDSQQQQRTSQSAANSLTPISLIQPLKLDLKQPAITITPIANSFVSAPSEQSIVKPEINLPTAVYDSATIEMISVLPPNSASPYRHLIRPVEALAQSRIPCPPPKKRVKDEHRVDPVKQWEEVRRRRALEKEKLRQSPFSKTSSLRSIRVSGKDSLTKSLLAAECQNSTYVKPFAATALSSGSLLASVTAGNMSSIPLNNGSCSSGIDSPKIGIHPAPNTVHNVQFNSYCDKKQIKPEMVENRKSVIDASVTNGHVPTVVNFVRNNCSSTASDSNGIYSMYKSKETNSYDGCMRPSVIQHTLSTVKRSGYANAFDSNASKAEEKSVPRHDSNKRPREVTLSIPAAHQKHGIVNSYLNIDAAGKQKDYYGPYNNVKNVPGMPSTLSNIQNKSYMAPSNTRLLFPPVRRPSPSPWTSSSPNGRPPSTHSSERRPDPPKDNDNVVLDLSCNKKLKPSINNTCHSGKFQMNSYAEEQELDLSLKSKRPTTKEISHEQKILNSHGVIPTQPTVLSRHNETFSVQSSELRGQHFPELKVKSKPPVLVSDKRVPALRTSTSTPSSVSTLPSHSQSYVPINNKIPTHYSTEYSLQQMPNILSSSNSVPPFYGFPFSLPPQQPPHLIPEQLQVNFASVYKDIYQKGVYPIPYPTYDFAPSVYPLYKDQNPSYIYYNPK